MLMGLCVLPFLFPFNDLHNEPDRLIETAALATAALTVLGGSIWASLALVTRGPPGLSPDAPPTPKGFSSFGAQLGGILIATLFVMGFFFQNDPESMCLATVWFIQVPYALLATRPGARTARMRFRLGVLLMGAALVVGALSLAVNIVPVIFFGQGALLAFASPADDWVRARRRSHAVGIVVIALVVGGAYQVTKALVDQRLIRYTAHIDAPVPIANPDLPMMNKRINRLTPAEYAEMDLQVLAPDDPIPWDPTIGSVAWFGRTPAGQPRVAALHRGDTAQRWFTWFQFGQAVLLEHAPNKPGHYVLNGTDGLLRMEEVIDTLDNADNWRNPAINMDNSWTAGELFDLCATFGCRADTQFASSWDEAADLH